MENKKVVFVSSYICPICEDGKTFRVKSTITPYELNKNPYCPKCGHHVNFEPIYSYIEENICGYSEQGDGIICVYSLD